MELDFQVLLPDNYYANPSSIYICFPMKIKKSTNEATDIDDNLITANNFFGHLEKEISATKYASDKELIPTFSPYEVYKHSNSMLRHSLRTRLQKLKKHCSTVKNQYIPTKPLLIEELTEMLLILIYRKE